MAKLEYKITLDEVINGLICKKDMDPIVEEIKIKSVEKFLRNAMHAPSSPITPSKAEELLNLFHKAKKAGMEF